jgi:putative nucleotidyltransferase with HDIG domain
MNDISRNLRSVSVDVPQTIAMRDSMVRALARVTQIRDPYTADHERKVALLARQIAQRLGLADSEWEVIEVGASIHDIGKLAIPGEILTRPGRLSPLEFEIVKTHCRIGHSVVADLDLPPDVGDIVLHHHERLDGSGYPDQLAGDAIGLPARVVAVADVIDAMASHRPYRPALGIVAARLEINRGRGQHYDPAVVDAALAVTSPAA